MTRPIPSRPRCCWARPGWPWRAASPFGQMKDEICSPGGTTIAGVRALEEGGLRAAAMNAVIAAYEKTLQLKK